MFGLRERISIRMKLPTHALQDGGNLDIIYDYSSLAKEI